MNYKIAFLLFFCSGIFSISAQENINKINANGERIGVWKKFYNNGKIRYQGQFENGKEIDVFKYYSIVSSEHPIIIKTFSKENNISKVEFFSESGILESKGEMNGKNRIGKWVYYQNEGKIISEENYSNGVLNGISKTYYKSGKITEILNYKNGKLNGSIKRFADNGVLLDDINYVNGKLNGLAKYYNLKGKLIYTGNYENDEKVGKWQYFSDEEAVSTKKYKE
jgi:antitoxin component YwqK of YwqJK toxin-antitoxin module